MTLVTLGYPYIGTPVHPIPSDIIMSGNPFIDSHAEASDSDESPNISEHTSDDGFVVDDTEEVYAVDQATLARQLDVCSECSIPCSIPFLIRN